MFLTRIEELLRGEYHYLEPEDECWFLREYTAGMGYQHGETNNLIFNLKKPVDRKGLPDWKYKEQPFNRSRASLRSA